MATKKTSPSGAPLTNCEDEDTCVSCEICLKEIPQSVAHSHEGPDYVHHFCGLQCMDSWQKRTASDASDK